MSGSKRYYWLKLNENFFEDDTIQWLEEQENGKDYVIFYLKLCLKSLDGEGKLIRYVGENLIPYDIKALSRLTSTPLDTVAVAMKTFLDIGLIERLDTGEIFMKQIDEMIGTETQYAVQKRRQRALNSKQDELSGQCPDNVLKCPTEIEIEKEIEIDIEIEVEDINKPPFTLKDKEFIINEWNKLDKNIPTIIKLNSGTKRYDSLNARVNDYGIEKIKEAIKNINKSSFLKGKNNRGWVITFDWFCKPNNFIKVLEGNYTDKNLKNKTDFEEREYDYEDLEKKLLGWD